MTPPGCDKETLSAFAGFVTRSIGLHFPEQRLPELAQKMSKAASEAGQDLGGYLLRLMSQPLSRQSVATLARALTIGETYFLRDPRSYQALTDHILPELLASRPGARTIRIWSAGCSTGEEAYTIAILLSRAGACLDNCSFSLLATDLNPHALELARRGVYSQWSFRNTPSWLMGYFSKRSDGRYQIAQAIRDMVTFREMNLADEAAFATTEGVMGQDIIFCRNVMLYFDERHIERTLAGFRGCLNREGWLFVGPTEVSHADLEGFARCGFDGAFALRRTEGGTTRERGGSMPRRPAPLPRPSDPLRRPEIAATPPTSPAQGAAVPHPAPASRRVDPPEPAKAAPAADAPAAPQQPAQGCLELAALYREGRYREAAEAAVALAGTGMERGEALVLGARAFANIGRLDEARACCEKAIACDRLKAPNHYLLSIILEQQGETSAAVKALKDALFVDDDYLLAYFALGNLHRRSGRKREAERNFTNALRLLEKRHPHDVLPEADGITAGRLAEMIRHGM